jgi:hypothetical protein
VHKEQLQATGTEKTTIRREAARQKGNKNENTNARNLPHYISEFTT